MEVSNLKQLKKALSNIPDDILENFGAGFADGGDFIQLLCWAEDERCGKVFSKYPFIKDVNEWLLNMTKLQHVFSSDDSDERDLVYERDCMISSEENIEVAIKY